MMRSLLRSCVLFLTLTALDCPDKGPDHFGPDPDAPHTGNLIGTVFSGTTPRPGAIVSLSGLADKTSTANASGMFSFTDLNVGSYTIQTTLPGFNCPSIAGIVELDKTVTVNVQCTVTPGSVNGTVRVSGTPQPGVTVTLVRSDTTISTVQTGTNGTYNIPNVPPGAYQVKVAAPNSTTCTAPQNINVTSTQTTTANFDCTPIPGSVTGTVRLNGTAQSGVGLTLKQGNTTIGTAQTASNGTYTFSNVPPGNYSVEISPPENSTCSDNPRAVTVAAAAASTANFDCAATTGTISGTVTLNGLAMTGGTVQVAQGANFTNAVPAADGSYSFPDLPPGQYDVRFFPPPGVSCSVTEQTVTVTAGQNRIVNFSCTTAPGSISGTVSGLPSGTTATVTLKTTGDEIVVTTTTTNASGQYTINGIAPGSYTVSVTPPNVVRCSGANQVFVESNQTKTSNFFCEPFTVTLSGSYRHIGPGSSETCLNIATSLPVQPGATYTVVWTGPGIVGPASRSGTLGPTGAASDRQSINLIGTYTATVTVTSGPVTVVKTVNVVVTEGTGLCQPPP